MIGALASGRLGTAALAALCVGLALVIRAELDGLDRVPAPPQAAGSSEAASPPISIPPETPPLPPLAQLDDMVARPLFVEGRRPTPEQPDAPAADPEQALNVMLTGIVITERGRLANFRAGTDARARVLGVGEFLDDWRIDEILPDRVILSSGGRREELLLKRDERDEAARQRRTRAERLRQTTRGERRTRPSTSPGDARQR